MPSGVQRLTVQPTVDDRVGARADLHAADDERLDLVHVEAFVDPGHEQELGPIGLGADLARLARRDRGGIGDERQHAERRLGERFRARRPPRPDPDVRFDLELLEAGSGHCYWGTPSASPKPPLRAVDLHGFDVTLGFDFALLIYHGSAVTLGATSRGCSTRFRRDAGVEVRLVAVAGSAVTVG